MGGIHYQSVPRSVLPGVRTALCFRNGMWDWGLGVERWSLCSVALLPLGGPPTPAPAMLNIRSSPRPYGPALGGYGIPGERHVRTRHAHRQHRALLRLSYHLQTLDERYRLIGTQ